VARSPARTRCDSDRRAYLSDARVSSALTFRVLLVPWSSPRARPVLVPRAVASLCASAWSSLLVPWSSRRSSSWSSLPLTGEGPRDGDEHFRNDTDRVLDRSGLRAGPSGSLGDDLSAPLVVSDTTRMETAAGRSSCFWSRPHMPVSSDPCCVTHARSFTGRPSCELTVPVSLRWKGAYRGSSS
jgi:hypothetical protein